MFSNPQKDEQKELQKKFANNTLKTAGILSIILWLAPFAISVFKRKAK